MTPQSGAPRHYSRRELLKIASVGAAAWVASDRLPAADTDGAKKTHFVTLSFDDGFEKSSLRAAEIYERHKLAACINVIATAHQPDFVSLDEYQRTPVGSFSLWNELQSRGHEIMPHGYKHANKRTLPLAEAKDLICRCHDIFARELKGFDPKRAVFNFPYNASTPEIEAWLAGEVLAFRTSGRQVNRVPQRGQAKLTCTSFGPGKIDAHLLGEIDKLLALPSGWLIYNTHGLDGEGWGPLSSSVLDQLLAHLVAMPHVSVVPAGRALLAAGSPGAPGR